MRIVEPTLKERADHLYRRLLLLQRVFPATREVDVEDVEWLGAGDGTQALALCGAIREVLDELISHAKALTAVPLPLSEWRPGDKSDDERWRALTELERREVMSLLSSYENLVSWVEGVTRRAPVLAAPGEVNPWGIDIHTPDPPREAREGVEYLKAERARIDRFRHEMGFLDKRRNGDT
jgi:phage tail protein X